MRPQNHSAAFFLSSLSLVSLFLVQACFDGGTHPSEHGKSGARISLDPELASQGGGLKKVAPSGANGLERFEVAIADISIAKDLTTQGSGFSNMTGGLSLFSQNLGDFNAIDTTTARDLNWQNHYIDFCDNGSLERMASSKPFTIRDTGDYHWAVVNWSPFFKVQATIPLGDGTSLYTHDGFIHTRQYPGQSDGRYYVTEPSTSMLQGPSEPALVRKNNGGTWFRFLRPLRLTEMDLDTGSLIQDTVGRDSTGAFIVHQIPSGKWNVLLVFNPEDFLFAGQNDSSNQSVTGDIVSADSSAYMRVPFLKATAIPYRDGEAVMRETYSFTVDIDAAWARGRYGMRLELYLIGDNVVAANVHSYPMDGQFAPPEVPTLFFVDALEDGSLSLQDWNHHPVFNGFQRKTTAGETGEVAWSSGMPDQPAQTLQYTLTGIQRMR